MSTEIGIQDDVLDPNITIGFKENKEESQEIRVEYSESLIANMVVYPK